jgi:bifunctional DNA-binding transcriptional regulator/antitoxin component of YhaV-PrlF toxin-antitoxin module
MLNEQIPPAEPHGSQRRFGEVTIRGRNQITLPVFATRAAGWERGDRLLVVLVHGDMVLLMRKPTDWARTFADALTDIFGSNEDTRAYLEQERTA